MTIEFCNLVQAFYVDKDLDMYDDISDTPALARTSNANADIGIDGVGSWISAQVQRRDQAYVR